MKYKCRDCGEEFDFPEEYVETHGFTDGPYEHWSECPFCKSPDFDYTEIVLEEEADAGC